MTFRRCNMAEEKKKEIVDAEDLVGTFLKGDR